MREWWYYFLLTAFFDSLPRISTSTTRIFSTRLSERISYVYSYLIENESRCYDSNYLLAHYTIYVERSFIYTIN